MIKKVSSETRKKIGDPKIAPLFKSEKDRFLITTEKGICLSGTEVKQKPRIDFSKKYDTFNRLEGMLKERNPKFFN